jgi:hypothetical protein
MRTAAPVTLTPVDTVVPTTDAVVVTTVQAESPEAITSKKAKRHDLHEDGFIVLHSFFAPG